MKGFVPTPPEVVDRMVARLFADRLPGPESSVLDPGCGPGAFIDGILRWSSRTGRTTPQVLGVEADPEHALVARERFASRKCVAIEHGDFLMPRSDRFDFIVGNPPYVPITGLDLAERSRYRASFQTAVGRFDLYLLFFEQALRLLKPGGRLVFITPEKFVYTQTAKPLRRLLDTCHIEELEFVDEATFGDLVTYPLITTVSRDKQDRPTRIRHRSGGEVSVDLRGRERSWLPALWGSPGGQVELTLADVCSRISCGIATGADQVFLVRTDELTDALRPFAFPTISGREIGPAARGGPRDSLLVPYDRCGDLLPEAELGPLGAYLSEPERRARLERRTCTLRKPWYAFHETPPLQEVSRPKILCKDIGQSPYFVADWDGSLVPRHSVYYIVAADVDAMGPLLGYLNSAQAATWLLAHCQRAANGFIRLQSHVLKRLPLPREFERFRSTAALDLVASVETA